MQREPRPRTSRRNADRRNVALLVTIPLEEARLQGWGAELHGEDCWPCLGSAEGRHLGTSLKAQALCRSGPSFVKSRFNLTRWRVFEASSCQRGAPALAHVPSGWKTERSTSFAAVQSHAPFQSENKPHTWCSVIEDKSSRAFRAAPRREMVLPCILSSGTEPALTAR